MNNKSRAIRNGIFECEKEWLKIARGDRRSEINLNFVNRLKLSEPSFDVNSKELKIVGEHMWDQYNQYSMSGIDISGTCVLLSLFCKKRCYLANLGDSRSIVSKRFGLNVEQVTKDHKPEELEERARIE